MNRETRLVKKRYGWQGTWLAVTAVMLATAPAALMAQVAGGSLSGTISDDSGAVIPNVQVKITHRTTGIVVRVMTNANGAYAAQNLASGLYDISLSATGFKTVTANMIKVDVGSQEVVDLNLPVGSQDTSVDVTASIPSIDLGSATLSHAVTGAEVRQLPLNGRDWTALAGLQPGVVAINSQSTPSVSNQRANSGYGAQFTIGGLRPDQNAYRLDGVSINDYANGAPADVIGIVLGVDTISEFTVSTNTADASYGRGAGGIINSTTKQGTNSLHGSAFEFARNSFFDAKNYFDRSDLPIPHFSRNQFGGTLGGPIRKDHTFLFGSYEGLQASTGITNSNLLVPSRAAIAAAAPAVKPFFALYPLAAVGNETGNVGTTSTLVQQVVGENFATVRLDETVSQKDSGFVTYLWDANSITQPDIFRNQTLGNVAGRQTLVIEETHSFSQSLVNALRFGFNRTRSDAPTTIAVTNPAAADPTLGFVPGRNVGSIAVTGWTTMPGGLGAIGEYNFNQNSYQAYDDGYFTHGNHSIKFGAAYERIQKNQTGQSSPSGGYTYASISNFLNNGSATSFTSGIGGTNSPRDLRALIAGVYLHDTWRATRYLTLNLGMRYEIATPPSETAGRLSNLPTLTSPTPRLGSPYFANPTLKNFEPRVGVAWDPFHDGKTAVRAGFGVYDNLPLPQMYILLSILSAPFYQQGSISATPAGNFPAANYPLLTPNRLRYSYIEPNPPRSYGMQWNLNVQQQLARNLTLTVAYVGTRGVHLPFQDSDVNYVLPTLSNNGVYTWPTPRGSGIRQNPNVGQIQALLWNSTSKYHGLQTLLNQTLSHGLQFGAAYTYSKAEDTESSSNAAGSYNTSVRRLYFCVACGFGLAEFDTRHIFNLNYVWHIPGPRTNAFAKALLGGWESSGIATLSTGQPFAPTISGDPLGMNSSTNAFDYPDRVYGPGCDTATRPHNAVTYLVTSCFKFPSNPLAFGNLRRNSIIGPGLLQVGNSFSRNIAVRAISESFSVQLRADIFNILNHANFAAPNASSLQLFTAAGAPVNNAGLISSTATTARQIQLSAKVSF